MRLFLFIIISISLGACRFANKPADLLPPKSLSAVWEIDYDTITQTEHLKNLREVSDSVTAENLIAVLNNSYPKVQMVYKTTSNDTLYVSIPESTVLTQQMGTTGASWYLTVATYTLTELKGIHFVYFDFEEGEHASPGVLTRSEK